jgi:maltooligosyltrehalose trehalohydrolase
MHVGTYTPEGTWLAARSRLGELVDLGVTTLEIMPVAEFPGRFGWSYDPANLFAPSRLYGEPDDFRRFVDAAHRVGIGVILDVVYNHMGRVGEELLRPFSDAYFSTRHDNEWGAPLNFDDEDASEVRAFVLDNVRYWIAEFHLDGFRLDATQAMFDDSPQHILLDISRAARAAGGERGVLLIAENEPQDARLVRPGVEGGYELDALVNDDFHHSALVRLTGRREAYYTDYRGSAEELVAAARWGFLFQGQRYAWQGKTRGTAAFDLEAPRFVHCLENHDQLANSAHGARVHQQTSPGRMRAMTALLLLSPQTPMLFQGQEFGATNPFLYFNDCGPEQADVVRQGRAEFLAQFPSLAVWDVQAQLADPCDESTFRRSMLDHAERERHRQVYDLHRDLLHLRREDRVLRIHKANLLHGATLGPSAFVLRFMSPGGDTRLLVVNLDCEVCLDSVATPLVAPPLGTRWDILWSSESPRYGCNGTPEVDTDSGWRMPAEAAVVLQPISHVGDS